MRSLRNVLLVLSLLLACNFTSKVSTFILGSLQAQAQSALPTLPPSPAPLPPNSIPPQVQPASPSPEDPVA